MDEDEAVRVQTTRIRELIAMLDDLPLEAVEPAVLYDVVRGTEGAGGGDG
jgi:hypothetical protein